MLKWLFEKLIGWPWCAHHWDLHDTIRVFNEPADHRPYKSIFVLRCTKCGDFKQQSVGS